MCASAVCVLNYPTKTVPKPLKGLRGDPVCKTRPSYFSEMFQENITGHSREFDDMLMCSAMLAGGSQHSKLIYIVAFNIVLAMTAITGNNLILICLHKHISLHLPSKLLLRNLVTTYLLVDVVSQPSLVAFWVSLLLELRQTCRYILAVTRTTSNILCGVSLATTAAISVDRHLALSLGLRYRGFVTIKRVYVALIVIWAIALAGVLPILWNNTARLISMITVSSGCLLIIIYCYSRIFIRLRILQNQVHAIPATSPVFVRRYQKTVTSAMLVQVALMFCYLPHIAVTPLKYRELRRGEISSFFFAYTITLTLVYFNSSLNPFLYCWTIKELRDAVKDTLRQLFCFPIQLE